MNKHDVYLIIFLLVFVGCFYAISSFFRGKEEKIAKVYYEDNLVLTIDLSKKLQEYRVMGANGEVRLIAGDGKIKVEEENSPKHLCSKQGYITSSFETIVCLPNKIVIEISSSEALDTVVK